MNIYTVAQISASGSTAIKIALIGAIATVVVGLLNFTLQLKSRTEQLDQARQQLELMRAGQITQRFTSAVEQLGNDKVDVRIGGIYALEGIAPSLEYRGQITEILSAYVQAHAAWPPTTPLSPGRPPEDRDQNHFPPLRTWAPDVQTAMIVLARREIAKSEQVLNLTRVDLRGLDLSHAKLAGALLRRSSLLRAILHHADLSEADLAGSILEHSDLRNANLRGAILHNARLAHADLGGAQLANAKLEGADLSTAIYGGIDLQGATANSATRWPPNFEPASHGVSISSS